MDSEHESNNLLEIRKFLGKKLRINNMVDYIYLDFDPFFVFSNQTTVTNEELLSFSDLIYQTGYGLEPDFKFRKFIAMPTDTLVIFRTENIPTRLSLEYKSTAIAVHIASIVAVYDNFIHENEVNELNDYIDSLIMLTEHEKERLKASVFYYFSENIDINLINHIVKNINDEHKKEIIDLVLTIIVADESINPKEVALLRRIYEFFGYKKMTPKRDILRFAKNKGIAIKKKSVYEYEDEVNAISNESSDEIPELENIVDDILNDFSF